MLDLGLAIFTVRAGADAILRQTKGDKPKSVSNFQAAFNPTKDKKAAPLWFGMRLWGKYADKLTQYVTKGKEVIVTCRPANIPVKAKQGRVSRHGADCFLTKESRELCLGALTSFKSGKKADGTPAKYSAEKLLDAIMTQVSAQAVFDVESVKLMGGPKKDGNAGNAEAEAEGEGILPGESASGAVDEDVPF